MAGVFSGHLLNAFNCAPVQPSSSTIITSGAMSFDARAHGNLEPFPIPHALFGHTPLTEDSTTAKHIATLQAKLDKKLGPEYISQRPGPGGGPKLTYAEGWKIINLTNEVFGFNGWNSSIVSIATDFMDYSEESKRFNVGVTAIVRVTLRDGTYHEDVGYGLLENAKSKGGALDKCKKEAVTDALKRTLRNFGNLLGNCLYDKSYAQEVVKIKVPPAKLDKSQLYRRPEFEERTPDPPVTHGQSTKHDEPCVKAEHGNQPETPITYVPRHLRQEMAAAATPKQAPAPARVPATPPQAPTHSRTSGSGVTDSRTNSHSPHSVGTWKSNGLTTPIQTPTPALPPPPPRVVATSPLARTHTAPERSVSFGEPMRARAGSTGAADQDAITIVQGDGNSRRHSDEDEDEDSFPLSTQDDAFLATVDLGEGDLGRPIDFEEGVGGESMIDASMLEPGLDSVWQSPAVPLQPQAHGRDHPGGGMSSSGGVSKKVTQSEVQAQLSAKFAPSTSDDLNTHPNPSTSASGRQPQPQPRSGPPNTASVSASTSSTPSTSSACAVPAQDVKPLRLATTSMGGFHFPPGMQQPQQHVSKPAMPACTRTTSNTAPRTGPTNALKRSADVMQAGWSSSTRPPIQGMGLAQRQQQEQKNANARHPSDDSEGNDSKRSKREH